MLPQIVDYIACLMSYRAIQVCRLCNFSALHLWQGGPTQSKLRKRLTEVFFSFNYLRQEGFVFTHTG